MTNKHKNILIWTLGSILLVAMTVGASAYVASNVAAVKKVEAKDNSQRITWKETRRPVASAQPQQRASSCDDANVVGAAIGAVAGGVVGNQFGKGKGKDLATIGGAIGGGAVGQQYIPTRNTLCP